jgi:hypothetical protein
MWFTVVTARRFIFLSFQPRLAAALLRSCSVVNSPTRRAGLSPAFQPASLAQRFTWFCPNHGLPTEPRPGLDGETMAKADDVAPDGPKDFSLFG